MLLQPKCRLLCVALFTEVIFATTVFLRSNTQVSLATDGFSYTRLRANPSNESTFANCGCNPIPEDLKTICARILYNGYNVYFYEDAGCNGTSVMDYKGPADETYTCGYLTMQSNSIRIDCSSKGTPAWRGGN